jgi:pimeloyl-ACP methyl ester carboxylesterase
MKNATRRFILSSSMATSAAMLTTSAARTASTGPLEGVMQRRLFTNWTGPAIPVWSFRPNGLPGDAPVLFIMHGVGRDADRYLSEWKSVATTYRFIAICPEFSQTAFPGALNYNLGGVLDANGGPRPTALWSFSAIAPIFEWFVEQERLSTAKFDLFGHSAGGQFAHRFAAFAAPPQLKRVVAANAGWYTLPEPTEAWPFGLNGAPGGLDTLRAWLASDLTILLGTMDTDPNHRSLNNDPPHRRQGPHRLARGVNFYASGKAIAARLSLPFGWQIDYAPGIDHNNGGMASFAAARLFPRPTQN